MYRRLIISIFLVLVSCSQLKSLVVAEPKYCLNVKQEKNMSLIYSYLVFENKPAFLSKVESVSTRLGYPANWVMGLMYIETGGTFDPSIQNQDTKATGLIQITREVAQELGTTVSQLKQMSNVDQLDYVYLYLKKYRSQVNSFYDLYFSVFWPAAIGKGNDYVLETSRLSASLVASQNSGYDLNKNKKITVLEVKTALDAKFKPEYLSLLKSKKMESKTLSIVSACLIITLGAISLYQHLNS